MRELREIKVLAQAGLWLCSDGWELQSLSLPSGDGLTFQQQKSVLEEAGVSLSVLRYLSYGADIVAEKHGALWRIECKGIGFGKPQTHKNNFDRAVASVVSYYDGIPRNRIGLALVDHPAHCRLLPLKVSRPLRQALDLWVLIVNPHSGSVRVYSPEDTRITLVGLDGSVVEVGW